MPDTTEIAKLIIEAGTQGFADVQASITGLETKLAALTASYKTGTTSIDDYLANGAKIKGQLDEQKAAFQVATDALAKHGTAQKAVAALSEPGAKSTRNLGQGFLELSRAVEDAQYGLNGVLNNLPPMIQRFGGSAGLAAGISLAAVAFNILLPKLIQAAKDMNLFGDKTADVRGQVEKLQERISELEAKKVKLAIDTYELDEAKKKLDRLQAAQREFDESIKKQASVESESGQRIADVLAEAPGGEGEFLNSVRAKQERDALTKNQALIDQTQTIKEATRKHAEAQEAKRVAQETGDAESAIAAAMESAKQQARINEANEKISEIQTNAKQVAEKSVGDILLRSKTAQGAEQAAAQKQLAEAARGVGREDIAVGIEMASPAAVKADRHEKDVIWRAQQKKKLEDDLRDINKQKQAAQAQADAMIADLLNPAGAEAEAAARKEAPEIFKTPAQKASDMAKFGHIETAAETKARKDDIATQKKRSQVADREMDEQAKAIAGGLIGQQAEGLIGQFEAGGLSTVEAQARVAQMVRQELQKQGFNLLRAGALSGKIAKGAASNVEKRQLGGISRGIPLTRAVRRKAKPAPTLKPLPVKVAPKNLTKDPNFGKPKPKIEKSPEQREKAEKEAIRQRDEQDRKIGAAFRNPHVDAANTRFQAEQKAIEERQAQQERASKAAQQRALEMARRRKEEDEARRARQQFAPPSPVAAAGAGGLQTAMGMMALGAVPPKPPEPPPAPALVPRPSPPPGLPPAQAAPDPTALIQQAIANQAQQANVLAQTQAAQAAMLNQLKNLASFTGGLAEQARKIIRVVKEIQGDISTNVATAQNHPSS